jgi:hypothetical protein
MFVNAFFRFRREAAEAKKCGLPAEGGEAGVAAEAKYAI